MTTSEEDTKIYSKLFGNIKNNYEVTMLTSDDKTYTYKKSDINFLPHEAKFIYLKGVSYRWRSITLLFNKKSEGDINKMATKIYKYLYKDKVYKKDKKVFGDAFILIENSDMTDAIYNHIINQLESNICINNCTNTIYNYFWVIILLLVLMFGYIIILL
jgi:hypothetical protein